MSEEVGLTTNEDDVDLDLEENFSTDLKNVLTTPSAEHADEAADKTHLPTATNVDCQDTSTMKFDTESNSQQDQKVNIGASSEAECKIDELPSQLCSDSQAVDISLSMKSSIPGKAFAVNSMPMVDSMSNPQDSVNIQSEPPSSHSLGLGSSATPVIDGHTTDKKSLLSQSSVKTDDKAVSMSMIVCVCVIVYKYHLNLLHLDAGIQKLA